MIEKLDLVVSWLDEDVEKCFSDIWEIIQDINNYLCFIVSNMWASGFAADHYIRNFINRYAAWFLRLNLKFSLWDWEISYDDFFYMISDLRFKIDFILNKDSFTYLDKAYLEWKLETEQLFK